MIPSKEKCKEIKKIINYLKSIYIDEVLHHLNLCLCQNFLSVYCRAPETFLLLVSSFIQAVLLGLDGAASSI